MRRVASFSLLAYFMPHLDHVHSPPHAQKARGQSA